MSKPLISIIIPVLNGEQYLGNCFKNIENQNYDNLELVFIDNNSSDNSNNIIKEYCNNIPNRKIIICEKKGPSASRNLGLKLCRGEYVSFLDVDDEILPNKFNILLTAFKKYPDIGMAIGHTYKYYQNGIKKLIDLGELKIGINDPPFSGMLWLRQFQHHPHISSSLIKKKSLNPGINFPEQLKFGEDVAFSIKIGLNNKVYFCNELVSIYHRHGNSAISIANKKISNTERYFQFYENFALKYFKKNNQDNIYQMAYGECSRMAFDILFKLVKNESKIHYMKNLRYLINKGLLTYSLYQYLLYILLPYKWANYIFFKYQDIKIRFSKDIFNFGK